MLILSDVLSPADVTRIRNGLETIPFVDGKTTAGAVARKVKSNQQADADAPGMEALRQFVREALERHALFGPYVRPARWSKLMISRYGPGDAYGLHTDDALMRDETGARLRTDLSFTLFLSEPETYDGGALLLDSLDGEREIRLPAGSAVVYRTGELHCVTPVTRGERLACVGWVQSLIRRADERDILFDLVRVRAHLPKGEARLLLDKASGNLMRLWSEL